MSVLSFLWTRFHQENTELRAHVDARFDRLAAQLTAVERLVNEIPTDKELVDALAAFQAAVIQAVTDANTRTTNDINALKAQIAAGGTVSQSDLDAVLAAQNAAVTAIAAIDPAAPVPPGP